MREIKRGGYYIRTSNDTDFRIYDIDDNLVAECNSLVECLDLVELQIVDVKTVERGD